MDIYTYGDHAATSLQLIEQGAQGVTFSMRRLSGRQEDMSGEGSCIHVIYLHSSLKIY